VNDVSFELEEKRAGGGGAAGADDDAAGTHAAHEEAIFELHTKLDEATEAAVANVMHVQNALFARLNALEVKVEKRHGELVSGSPRAAADAGEASPHDRLD
jgi:hypothetical protein